MPTISTDIDWAAEHIASVYVRDECYRFYVRQRRLHCNPLELLDLWLRVPVCADCIQSDPFEWQRLADVRPETWEEDILLVVGKSTLAKIQMLLLKDSRYALVCQRCGRSLRPWNGDELYVVHDHAEERYGIPLDTPGRRQPPEWLRKRIMKLYGNECFGCGVSAENAELHIDHIRPQSLGGDAAFRNLQPLCEGCGREKGNAEPSERTVCSNIYFGLQPSDAYEGLFW